MNGSSYSTTPSAKKLGIKEGTLILGYHLPDDCPEKLHLLPAGVRLTKEARTSDFIHLFIRSRRELEEILPDFKAALNKEGMLWINWPKAASGILCDINREGVRELGLKQGLVDVKVASFDSTWSGLKFVYRVKDR